MSTFFTKLPRFFKSKWTIGILILVLSGGGYWFFVRSSSTTYQFIAVTRGSITETVSATGNTTPTKSVSLGFQNSGTIARVNYALGDRVSAGAVIAELNTASLSAALAQAQANLASAEANLAALRDGTRPEQLAIYQNAVTQDQAALGLKQMEGSLMRAAIASHLRKLVSADGKFERAGWNPFELPAETD